MRRLYTAKDLRTLVSESFTVIDSEEKGLAFPHSTHPDLGDDATSYYLLTRTFRRSDPAAKRVLREVRKLLSDGPNSVDFDSARSLTIPG